jgi:ABC-type transport system substrate-binding protein
MKFASSVIGLLLAALVAAAGDDPVPRRGGTLRLALPTDLNSLDPAVAYDTISQPFVMLLYRGLVEYDDGVNLLPCLATDWSVSADRRTYTFHLRPGVKFSNGREVAASDFVFSLRRLLEPKTGGTSEAFFEEIAGAKEFRAGKAADVRGLRAPRRDTIEIELEQPDPSFLYVLTLPGALVVPREAVEQFGRSFGSHPIGAGPYVLTQWQRGVKMRFERNPFFFGADCQNLDAIEVMVGGDSALHLMMFERGELDIADVTVDLGIPVPDFVRIQRSPLWRGLIETTPAALTGFLSMNTEMEPFNDPKVRQAVSHAIDKKKIVKLLHNTDIAATGILPPPMPGFNSNLTAYTYDPAKARQLLAESGHPDSFSCKLWYDAWDQTAIPKASAIQYDLAQVGIRVELNPVTLPALLDSDGRRKTVQCVLSSWSQDYPDPSDFLDAMFNGTRISEEGCQNVSFYNNPNVNALLAEAAICPEPDRRLRLYQEAEQTIVADAPVVPLDYQRVFALRQPWLHGLRLHPVLYFRFERLWKDP